MATDIRCPGCGYKFQMEEAVSEEYKKELREQMIGFTKKKEEEYLKKLEEMNRHAEKQQLAFDKRLSDEKSRLSRDLEETLRKSIAADFENKVKILECSSREMEEKLRSARQKELEFLRKEQELSHREADMELQLQRRLQQERTLISEQVRKQEHERTSVKENEFQLRLRELEKQLDDQKKLADEMRRKAEQGSMQLQGEAQELLLETVLRDKFPFDVIMEVGKGVEGADCIQVVRNHTGRECGKIIYESKRAKIWNSVWVDKLKNDMRSKQADLAILVTQVMPRGMECFGEKDGVWVCSFREVAGMAAALRNAILRISESQKLEENKGEKMQMLFKFLTGIEFKQQIEAIVEGFVAIRESIIREKVFMERTWKEREKQLDKVLLNTSGMYGSIKGIAGSSVETIALLEGEEEPERDMAH